MLVGILFTCGYTVIVTGSLLLFIREVVKHPTFAKIMQRMARYEYPWLFKRTCERKDDEE